MKPFGVSNHRLLKIVAAIGFATATPVPGAMAALADQETLLAGQVEVRIVAVGIDLAPATKITLSARISSKGDTVALARAANGKLFDDVCAAIQKAGGDAHKVRIIPPARGLGFVGNAPFESDDLSEMAQGQQLPTVPKPRPTISNSIEITLPDVALYEKIRDAMEAAGAKDVSGPTYALIDDTNARRAAKADAIHRAERDAQTYADTLGLKIVRLTRVFESGSNGGDFAGAAQLYQQFSSQFLGETDATGARVKTTQTIVATFVLAPK